MVVQVQKQVAHGERVGDHVDNNEYVEELVVKVAVGSKEKPRNEAQQRVEEG